MIATTALATRRHPEETLDARAVSGAREQFIRMAERELDRVYRLAGLILGNSAEAEDAVGDALERAWRDLDGLRDPAAFQAWFDRIVVNACRDANRRRSRIRFIALDGHDPSAAVDGFREILDADAALRSIDGLRGDEREIVILHFWADLTLDAVAERLGLPPGTVRSRFHRALVRMRRSLASADRGGRGE